MQVKVYSKQSIRKAVPERKTILIAINDTSDITKSRNYITRDKYAGISIHYFRGDLLWKTKSVTNAHSRLVTR